MATMLPLWLAAPQLARADSGLSACFEALSSEDLVKAGLIAANPEFLQCTSQAAGGDVVMIAVIAAMTGIMAAGAFDSQASCEKVVDTVIASVMIDVFKGLESAIDLSSLFGSDFVNSLNGDLASTGIQALRTALAPIFSYIDCGCAVAGTIAEEAHLLKQYLQSVAGCAGFLLDVGKEAVKVVGDIAKGIGSFFKQAGELAACVATFGLWCPGSGGPDRDPYDMACTDSVHQNPFTCGPGLQCATVDKAHSKVAYDPVDGDTWNGCASCTGLPFSKANAGGGCSCEKNFSAASDDHYGLAACSCGGQYELASVGGQTQCLCALGTVQEDGKFTCHACGPHAAPDGSRTACIACSADQTVSADGLSCQPCPAGQGMGANGQCVSISCPAGQHRVETGFNPSFAHYTDQCACDAAGDVVVGGSKCEVRVTCGAGQSVDNDTNTCKSNCPDGQVYDAGYHCSGEFCDPSKNIAPSCSACMGPNAYVSNNTCQTVTCAGYQTVNDNHTCSNICPQNMVHASNAAAIFGLAEGGNSGFEAGKSAGQGGGPGGLAGLGLATEAGGAGAFKETGGSPPIAAYNSCSACPNKDDIVFENKCVSCPAGTSHGKGNSCVSICSDPQAYDAASNSCVTCKPGTYATSVSAVQVGSGESQTNTYSFCAADPNGVPSCKANEFIVNDVCTACTPGQKGSADGGSCEAACGPGQVYVEASGGGGAIPGIVDPLTGKMRPEGNLPTYSVFLCQACANPSDTVVNNSCFSSQTRRPRVTKAGDPTGWKAVDLSSYGLTPQQKASMTVVPAGIAVRLLGSGQAGTGVSVPANNDPLRRKPLFPFGSASYTTETPGARDPQGQGSAEPRRQLPGGAYGSGTLGAEPDRPPTGTGPSRSSGRGDQGSYSSGTLGAKPDDDPSKQGAGGQSDKIYKLDPDGVNKLHGGGKGRRPSGDGSSGAVGETLGVEPPAGSQGKQSSKVYKLDPDGVDKLHGGGKGKRPGGRSSGAVGQTLGAEPPAGSSGNAAGKKTKLDPDGVNKYGSKSSPQGETTGPSLKTRPTLSTETPGFGVQARPKLPDAKQLPTERPNAAGSAPQRATLPSLSTSQPTLTPGNKSRPTLQRSNTPTTIPLGSPGGSSAKPPWPNIR